MCKGPATPTTATASSAVTTTVGESGANNKNKKRLISTSELRRHNSPKSDPWTSVHGRVLDISAFASRHPGGDVILLSSGRDATVLFETYHPRGVPPSLLDKLQIGTLVDEGTEDDSPPSSFYSWESEFYPTLKRRVVARLDELKLTRRGSTEIFVKSILILTGFWYSLIRMYLAPTLSTAAIWSVAMGTFASFVGTCIQHDGNHGAFSRHRWVNKVAGWTLDMIGASAFTWEVQHMLGHHPYTNLLDCREEKAKEDGSAVSVDEKDQESDPDVFSSFPLVRMHPVHSPSWYNAYQHLYAPLLFALMTLAKVFHQDLEVATSKRLYHIDATSRYGSIWNVVRFWTMKVVTTGYMIGLPIYFHGFWGGLGLFVLGHCVCGELLATMFIVNHVIEGVAFARKNDLKSSSADSSGGGSPGKPSTVDGVTPMERTVKTTRPVPLNDWAAVQCQTSVNWSSGSWFWNHFSGGLSHQIEHHLFPSICHTNYVYIQDVVESTCDEFGVPYQSESSLWSAYWKMIAHLKSMGTMAGCLEGTESKKDA